jgi:smad nuclear-interacting protein 1
MSALLKRSSFLTTRFFVQHAVFQYRLVEFTRADGTRGRKVTPYIIDLDSANGTFVNNQKIEPRKYVQVPML